jgi:hypothetical protein
VRAVEFELHAAVKSDPNISKSRLTRRQFHKTSPK